MTADEWIREFAGEIGAPAPDRDQMDEILRLAAVAAHASERIAAPIACYLAGLTGRPLDEAIDLAERIGPSGPA
jgi:Domain of unknown function (DUF6457)